jgi:hypothetical protein
MSWDFMQKGLGVMTANTLIVIGVSMLTNRFIELPVQSRARSTARAAGPDGRAPSLEN